MNQDMNNDKDRKLNGVSESGMDSFFDLNQDGKVSISETVKADAELAETYAESAQKKGGPKGKLAGIFGKFFRAVGRNK